jgi:hypothetical protein
VPSTAHAVAAGAAAATVGEYGKVRELTPTLMRTRRKQQQMRGKKM